jgi:hypothetical protein
VDQNAVSQCRGGRGSGRSAGSTGRRTDAGPGRFYFHNRAKLHRLVTIGRRVRGHPAGYLGAAGPSDFVELLNGRYAVYDKATGNLLEAKTQNDFWRDAGVAIGSGFPASSFDPRIVFDPSSGHWFASALTDGQSPQSRILIGVSDGSDPTAGWQAFGVQADPNQLRSADFDSLGFNKDGVYIGANLYPNDPNSNLPLAAELLVTNKANLIAGAPTGTLFANIDVNDTGFTPQPVNDYDNGPTPELIYSAYNSPLGVFKSSQVVGPNEGNALDAADGFFAVTPFDSPPPANQPGLPASIDSGDTRLNTSIIKQNGKIWGVHAVLNGTHSALHWFRQDAATGTLEEEGIIGDDTSDYYDGSIAVNPAGFVVIGYTRSSDTEFASSYASTGFYDGTTTTFDAPRLLKAGTDTYDETSPSPDVSIDNSSVNRWGDYSATTVDPANPDTFWTIQEWASGPASWSTQITELTVAPEPASLALLAAGVLPLLRRRRARASTRGAIGRRG